MEHSVRHLVRSLAMATAVLVALTTMPETAWAQRGGRGGGGGGNRGGGGTATPRGGHATGSAPVVGRAVPRGVAPGHPIAGRPGGGYRPGYAYPPYWGGLGLGWGYGGYYGWGYWGPGWWGPGYASSMWWPGCGWWGAPALYYPPYWGVVSEARLLVKPRETEVYVDGALAGIVDQYAGVFQLLTLAPGTHQISLYLDGHKRSDSNVYVAPGSTIKLRHTMEALPDGAPQDERPTPPIRQQSTAVAPESPDVPSAPQGRGRSPNAPSMAVAPTGHSRPAAGDAATLVIRVRPTDAEVLIDGQAWQTDGARPLEVLVPAGRVRVEVRKPGFAPFSTELTVGAGDVRPLNVNLPAARGAGL